MNKEGIFSLLGYSSIFLIGVSLGQSLFGRKPLEAWYRLVNNLVLLDLALWGVLFLLDLLNFSVSRRLVSFFLESSSPSTCSLCNKYVLIG